LPPITHFAYRIDCWDDDGENIVENLAGVEHFTVAKATYRAAQLGNIARAVPSVLALHRWSWIGEPNASLPRHIAGTDRLLKRHLRLQPSRPLPLRAAMKIQGINDHFTPRPVSRLLHNLTCNRRRRSKPSRRTPPATRPIHYELAPVDGGSLSKIAHKARHRAAPLGYPRFMSQLGVSVMHSDSWRGPSRRSP
jgi:hypothetical protein